MGLCALPFIYLGPNHWLKNPNIFLTSSERLQEKNTNRWLGQYSIGTPQKKAETTVKQALTQAPALRLPDPEKAYQLYFHKKEEIALGVLTERLGPKPQPVTYLSKRLNPTAWGWPPCLWNLATIAILIEDDFKLSFGGKLFLPANKWNNS